MRDFTFKNLREVKYTAPWWKRLLGLDSNAEYVQGLVMYGSAGNFFSAQCPMNAGDLEKLLDSCNSLKNYRGATEPEAVASGSQTDERSDGGPGL